MNMKNFNRMLLQLRRTLAPRKGKKGSTLAFVMAIGAALVIWVMCIMPLMVSSGTVAYETQGLHNIYLGNRSVIEFCKTELEYTVKNAVDGLPATFLVVKDGNKYAAVPKRNPDTGLLNTTGNGTLLGYTQYTDYETTTDMTDKPQTQNNVVTENGQKVHAICSVGVNDETGLFSIVITTYNKGVKGMQYTATFTPSGSLKIHPEAYNYGDALPLSDFVLVDGQLGANTIWNSNITMNNAESMTFYESMLIQPNANVDLNTYANAGEYPVVFKTTAHTSLAEGSSIGEQVNEGYLSSSEDWIIPHRDSSKPNTKGYVMYNNGQVWIRTKDGNGAAGSNGTYNITSGCTLYYNGAAQFSGKIQTYTITASYVGTDYSAELESGELFTKYKEGEVNILPFSGFPLDKPDASSSVNTNNKHTIDKTYSVQSIVSEPKGNKTIYKVTLGYDVDQETNAILADASLVYGYIKVTNNTAGDVVWQNSNVITIEEAPSNTVSYFFYAYKPASYDANTCKITQASDVVEAGMMFKPTEVSSLTAGSYLIGNASNNVLNTSGNLSGYADFNMDGFVVCSELPTAYTWTASTSSSKWAFQNSGKYLTLTGTIQEKMGTESATHKTSTFRSHKCNKITCTIDKVSNLDVSMVSSAAYFTLNNGALSQEITKSVTSTKTYQCTNSSNSSSNNPSTTFDLKTTLYLDLSNQTTATASQTSNQSVNFYKIPTTPAKPQVKTATCTLKDNVAYNATGFAQDLSELINVGNGSIKEIYANGEAIPTINDKYYLNAGQYTIVVRAQVGGINVWKSLGTLTVKRNETANVSTDLVVTAAVDSVDKFRVKVAATGWHQDGGYHYFGYREKGTTDIKWYSTLDVAMDFRLSYGDYEFFVMEVGSNNYAPVQSAKVDCTVAMPAVDGNTMNSGMFWYTVKDDGTVDKWYKLPADVYPGRITNVRFNYECKKQGQLVGSSSTSTSWSPTYNGGTYVVDESLGGFIGYVYTYTFKYCEVTIKNPNNTTTIAKIGAPMGSNQIGNHASSIVQGTSLYFMGNPSINTHGNSVTLTTDLLVLNSQFTNDNVANGNDILLVQAYTEHKDKVLVYAGSDITNLAGEPLFRAGYFYKIPSNSNLFGISSADVEEVGTTTTTAVKNLFRTKQFPNIIMDVANASRQQLSRIVSSETIGWTKNGKLKGSNVNSNAAYCVTAYVTEIEGAVGYKANRILIAAAKESGYVLDVPANLTLTTRYLSVDADEVKGAANVSFILKNLAQDQNFIQSLSNALGITNSYSKTLQMDYERTTRISPSGKVPSTFTAQICRYQDGVNLFGNPPPSNQSLVATYTTTDIEDLFTGGLSGLASTVKTVDRYVSLEADGNNTVINLSALLSVNLNIYANYVYFSPEVTGINMSSWMDSDITISTQESGYTTHEYLGLFQTHSADSYAGTILFFGNNFKIQYPNGRTVTIEKGFYRVKNAVALSEFGNANNIGGEGSRIEAILLFSWEGEQYLQGKEKLRQYSVYINPTTGQFNDTYVDTGLDDNTSDGSNGFSGGSTK